MPVEFLNQCKVNEIKESIAVQLSELGGGRQGGWQAYLEECQAALFREAKERSRGWVVVPCNHPKTELSYKKVADGHPLRLWKVCTDIAAPPTEVINRILRDRHIWDEDLHSSKIVAQMNKSAEVFHIVRRNIEPLSYTDYCVIRTWKTDLPKGGCVIVETSVEYPDAPHIPNSIRGIVLASRYLIEPGGSGQSRLMHLSRVDTRLYLPIQQGLRILIENCCRGRMPEWYHKNYGHLSAVHIANLQASFHVHQSTTGPESKV